jgi:hypothetical protein
MPIEKAIAMPSEKNPSSQVLMIRIHKEKSGTVKVPDALLFEFVSDFALLILELTDSCDNHGANMSCCSAEFYLT